ncbi:MAG TPA: hypothetical protein VH328_12435 [Burkholderiaceae bacterium]|jgi:hypothetical protein|nr:hypothetical protein [Burkholderiaceae bacterium]
MLHRIVLVWIGGVGIVAAGLAVAYVGAARDGATVPDANAFCVVAPPAAVVSATTGRDAHFDVQVPDVDPPEGRPFATSRPVREGDVVEFTVTSRRAGQLAVHGLTDMEPIAAGGSRTFAFRAIYSGRFPLHFHGPQGQHVEIAALDILPAAAGTR